MQPTTKNRGTKYLNLFILPLSIFLLYNCSAKVSKKETNISQSEKNVDLQNPQDAVKPDLKNANEKPQAEMKKVSEPSTDLAKSGITEIPAEFPGGAAVLRKKLNETVNTNAVKASEGLIKAIVFFDIDENGKTSNFSVEGENADLNNEVLRATKAINENVVWKPAVANGFPVLSHFKIPYSMYIENKSNKK